VTGRRPADSDPVRPAGVLARALGRGQLNRGGASPFVATRLASGPIIRAEMPGLEGERGTSINGPSVIRVPDWVEERLGVYYLYFAHHRGHEIRLAHADRLEGPWTVRPHGVLQLADTAASDHIASPDVHLDHERRLVRMYFHGCDAQTPTRQVSFLATSPNGLEFRAAPQVLAPFYLRVFRHEGWYYGLAKLQNKSGVLLRSLDGAGRFELGRKILPRMRHAAVLTCGNRAWLFYTRIGDAPEHLLCARLDLEHDWKRWTPNTEAVVLEPELDYEGADEPVTASRSGAAAGRRCELRDPAVLVDEGIVYLFYAIAGEQGIAVAELRPHP
jgi:hypothetical protein